MIIIFCLMGDSSFPLTLVLVLKLEPFIYDISSELNLPIFLVSDIKSTPTYFFCCFSSAFFYVVTNEVHTQFLLKFSFIPFSKHIFPNFWFRVNIVSLVLKSEALSPILIAWCLEFVTFFLHLATVAHYLDSTLVSLYLLLWILYFFSCQNASIVRTDKPKAMDIGNIQLFGRTDWQDFTR